MTAEEYLLLHVVLEDAVDNARNEYIVGKSIYSEYYRPARLAALKLDWESAQRALALVESWEPK